MTEAEFQRYWVEVHAPRYAAKIPQFVQYCVDTRLPGPPGPPDPLWSGVAEIWLENEEQQLASLTSTEYVEGARRDEPRWAAFWRTLGLDTDAHVVVAGEPQRADDPHVKLFILVKRAAGMPLDRFRTHSLREFAPLLGELPGLVRHLQGHTRDSAYAIGEAPLDCAHQVCFAGEDELRRAMAGPEYAKAIIALRDFTEPRYLHEMAVRENWIIGPVPGHRV